MHPPGLHLSESRDGYGYGYGTSGLTTLILLRSASAYRLALHTPFKNPSFCASLFSESSLSPMARTKPQSAYVWFSPVYLPFSSTLPTEICTDAWSLALMMRLVALHLRGT